MARKQYNHLFGQSFILFRSGNVEDVVVFHFFYGWNSGAGREVTDKFAMSTYADYPDLFEVFYSDHIDYGLIEEVIRRSEVPYNLSDKPRLCSQQMTKFDLSVGVSSVGMIRVENLE
jgi:hypothetical protein